VDFREERRSFHGEPEFLVTATRFAARGEAEVEENGRTLQIWEGIPGEVARVRLEHRGQNQSLARWVSASKPSEHRVNPPCEKYAACGGCPWMHLDAAGQEDGRITHVRGELAEAGLGDVVVAGHVHPSPDGLQGFRHLIKVAAGESDTGRLRLGAWGRRNRHVIPIPDCNVAAPVLRRVMNALAYHMIALDLRPFNPETGDGVVRVFVLRASRTTGQVMVTIVAGRHIFALGELAERICAQESSITGVWLHINDGPGNAIFGRDGGVIGLKPLAGKDHIEEKLNDVVYRVGPGDFFQTNPAMAEVLYRRTLERLELTHGVPFVDLYCGVGGFAIPAAKITGWALGVEEVAGAVARAREAAQRNRVVAEFVAGKVEELAPQLESRLEGTRPVMTVNPARRGLEPGVVDTIVKLAPRRIGYVSCSPRAMARDLALFKAAGYEIGEIELFDMFPNTPHVECLAILDAPNADSTRRAPRRRVASRA
jgi:23S rRNA (uracil1939-C5)-methyltransferase